MASTSQGQDTIRDSDTPVPQIIHDSSASNKVNEASKSGDAMAQSDQMPKDNEDNSTDQPQSQSKGSSSGNERKSTKTSARIFREVRALQDRLLQLEHQAAEDVGGEKEEISSSDEKAALGSKDDKELGQHIRRARLAKKWAKKAEEDAEQTLNEPHKRKRWKPEFGLSGLRGQGIGGPDDSDIPDFITSHDFQEVRPGRGIRPPTSLRPIYSQKLGPPTQWDMSDCDEWSSDESTTSRDFNYFRARIRGDFEWELLRLQTQRERYKKHKEAQRLRQIQQENAQVGENSDEEAAGEAVEKTVEEHPIARLNHVEWVMFKALRRASPTMSAVIDILVGEPVISDDSRAWGGPSRPHTKMKTNVRTQAALQQPATHSAHRSPEDPLPERIRINSIHLIMTLSVILGSEFGDFRHAASIVMLRPFRMLTYYDKKLRDWHSKLSGDLRSGQPTSGENTDAADLPLPDIIAETQSEDDSSDTDSVSEVEDPRGYTTSETTLEHLTCLFDFMDKYLVKKQAYLSGHDCEKISFPDIWHFFKPGDIVIGSDGKQAYQVVNITSSRHRGTSRWATFYNEERKDKKSKQEQIKIQCVYIHFDGELLGPVSEWFSVKRFHGWKAVTALPIYPLRFHGLHSLESRTLKVRPNGGEEEKVAKGLAEVRQKLISRGKVFIEVAAVKHMYYAGLTVDTRDEVESQVMIDFQEAFTNHDSWRPKITRLVGAMANDNSSNYSSDDDEECTAECCAAELVHDDAYVESERHEDFINNTMAEIQSTAHNLPSAAIFPRSLEEIQTSSNALTDDELLIMSYRVFGFVLRDRTWAELDLTYITEVSGGAGTNATTSNDDEIDEENPGAFGELVLPGGHKNMILSLISQHFRSKASQKYSDERVDIVRGKGKGLIILLHGAPGVGKTTTAEGVAERFKKPLFQITCGDLGSDAKDVENALQTNFALANKWDCILLLDEADVFLAERRAKDFIRNGLVAVFLRVLEYYGGILFLTTNRIGDFDEAFASRIHMSLYYPPLDELSTAKVFQLNLNLIKARYAEKGRKIKIDELEINHAVGQYFRDHPKARWNGRQIRNACQTALALAEFDAQPKGHKYDLKTVESGAKVHLTTENLQTVSKAYLEFIEYLKAVHGADADTYAKEAGVRALEEVIAAALVSGRSSEGRPAGQGIGKKENPLHSFKLKPPSQGPPTMATAPQIAQADYMQQQFRGVSNTPVRSGQYHGESPAASSHHVYGQRSGMTSGGYSQDQNYQQPGPYRSHTPSQPPYDQGQPRFEVTPQGPGFHNDPLSPPTTAGSSQQHPTQDIPVVGRDPHVRAGNIPPQEPDTQGHQWTGNHPGEYPSNW